MPNKTNKNNGSKYWTLGELADRFYTSRFNHDEMHDWGEDEDIDNSRQHRLYNKGDTKNLIKKFAAYFEWVLCEENLSRIYITDNITLIRESKLPKVRRANRTDVIRRKGDVKAGEYYVTQGKYSWLMWTKGELMDRMREVQAKDPEFIERVEIKKIEAEERNKEIRNANESKQDAE